jgi:hypothetical protein
VTLPGTHSHTDGRETSATNSERPARILSDAEQTAVSAASLAFLLVAVIGAIASFEPARAIGVALFALFGLGSAVLAVTKRYQREIYLVLNVSIGLAIAAIVGSVIVELQAWYPVAVGIAVAAIATAIHLIVLCNAALRRAARLKSDSGRHVRATLSTSTTAVE